MRGITGLRCGPPLSLFHLPFNYLVLISLLIFSTNLLCYSFQYTNEEISSYEDVYSTARNEHFNGISKFDATLQEMGQPKEKRKNLTCHVCYSETHPECINSTRFQITTSDYEYSEKDSPIGFPQQCPNEGYVCSVRKFAFSQSNGTGHGAMRTFAVKRNCTLVKKCEPGCVVMGERTRIYVCSTCCTADLCNIGNGAYGVVSYWSFLFGNTIGLIFLSLCMTS